MTDGNWWVNIHILSALGERTLRCVFCWGSQNPSKKMTPEDDKLPVTVPGFVMYPLLAPFPSFFHSPK